MASPSRARDPAAARLRGHVGASLAQLGAPLAGDEATRAWLATARVMAAGLPGTSRDDRLELGAAYVGLRAAVLGGAGLEDRGPGAPGGEDFQLGYLDCVTEAARRGARELERLQAAARRI